MLAYLYLAIAIVAEVIATTSMKAVDGFNKPLPLLLVIGGYGLAFWMLILVVRSIPIGIAYAIWAGLGIVLVSVAAFLIYGQRLDMPAILGMAAHQLADHRRGRDALADRHRMHPDATRPQCRQAEAKALGDAPSVGRRPARAP